MLWHPTQDTSIKCNFINRIVNFPSFVMFVSKYVSCYDISEKVFFIEHGVAIVRIFSGEKYLFRQMSRLWAFDSAILIYFHVFSNTQAVQSSMNDTVHCNKKGSLEILLLLWLWLGAA